MSLQGERLKEIRESLRLTQQQMAEKLGIAYQNVGKAEKNKSKFSNDTLTILLQEYNVNINYLLAGIGNPFLTKQDKDGEIKENVRELIEEALKKRGL
jgi:transcriptional regulator with XRE-family HTH domain